MVFGCVCALCYSIWFSVLYLVHCDWFGMCLVIVFGWMCACEGVLLNVLYLCGILWLGVCLVAVFGLVCALYLVWCVLYGIVFGLMCTFVASFGWVCTFVASFLVWCVPWDIV